jgi:hypothetical protein
MMLFSRTDSTETIEIETRIATIRVRRRFIFPSSSSLETFWYICLLQKIVLLSTKIPKGQSNPNYFFSEEKGVNWPLIFFVLLISKSTLGLRVQDLSLYVSKLRFFSTTNDTRATDWEWLFYVGIWFICQKRKKINCMSIKKKRKKRIRKDISN